MLNNVTNIPSSGTTIKPTIDNDIDYIISFGGRRGYLLKKNTGTGPDEWMSKKKNIGTGTLNTSRYWYSMYCHYRPVILAEPVSSTSLWDAHVICIARYAVREESPIFLIYILLINIRPNQLIWLLKNS